jgi:hypothetical protein
MDEGMQIDDSWRHASNVASSRHESREPDSKRTIERDATLWKHLVQSRSTDEGMQMDESDKQQQNASGSINESVEPDSNVTAEADAPLEKHFSQSR